MYAKLACNHLEKIELCAKKKVYGYFSINSLIMFLSHPRSTQPKDTPLRFLAFIHTYALLIGFEEGSTKISCR
jgi:hypothetical protein